MCLHDTYAVVIVDDKTWEIVSFTMNKTIASGLRIAMKPC